MYMNNEGKYGKYILQDIILPSMLTTPEKVKEYYDAGKRRILWIDSQNMSCNFQMNSCWMVHASRDFRIGQEAEGGYSMALPHVHDADELLGFLGSDPENPSDLGGEVEFHIEGEKHILTKSTYIFIPAGIRHVPLYTNRVDRPIFHFSLLLSSNYSLTRDDGLEIKT